MNALTQMTCVPCRGDESAADEAEIARFKPLIPDWQIIDCAGEPRLQRVYTFKDFERALVFTNEVGALAESANHHPAILTEWGRVTVTWWTHKIHGLHRNDFIMAARTDAVYP